MKNTRVIKLTQGKNTLVDVGDYEFLSRFKWHAVSRGSKFYARNGKLGYMHRIIIHPGSDEQVDHRDGNGLNNVRSNLRRSSNSQNQMNKKKQGGNTTSRYKGVYWNKRDRIWVVRITRDGSRLFVGRFTSENKAALAYNKKASELFGDFALINNIFESDRRNPEEE